MENDIPMTHRDFPSLKFADSILLIQLGMLLSLIYFLHLGYYI